MSTFSHRSNVISRTRQAATALLTAYEDLLGASEWGNGISNQIVDANGTDPNAQGYTAGDFAGNEGLRKSDINQALGMAMTALTTLITSNDGKKFEDIRL